MAEWDCPTAREGGKRREDLEEQGTESEGFEGNGMFHESLKQPG